MGLRPGTVIGGEYVVGRPLAQGGMGAVYAAVQRSTGAERALKLMHPSLVGDERLRAMFDREARASARIESDHVVQVLAAGVDDETGSPWLVMELLDGETLAHAIERGPLPFADVSRIVAELGHALGAAHAALDPLVHRDLKPENVFLARTKRRDGSWSVKLLDFGIAKVLDDARGAGTTLPAGTPLWMAPEQSDHGAKVTPATDVWALGLVAFAALTGRAYWRAATSHGVSVASLLKEVLLAPIEPASVRARDLGVEAAIPPGFDAWFAKCVARAPTERYADANEARTAWEALIGEHGASLALAATEVAPLQRSPTTSALAATPAVIAVMSAASPRRWRWPLAAVGCLAIAAGLALLARAAPSGSPLAAKLGHRPADKSIDAARPAMDAWAHRIVDPELPPANDQEAGDRRRHDLELVVKSPFVASRVKEDALGRLVRLPERGLPSRAIRTVVTEQASPILSKCYAAERAAHPKLAAAIEIAFTIRGDGSVKDALVAKSNYDGAAFTKCILGAFEGLKFPTHDGQAVTVSYPLAFTPD